MMHFVRNPEFGKDYAPGYVFFSYNTSSLISAGIALFSRNEAKNGIPISHCGIITGKNECIEAANPGGVQRSNFIEKYVNPHEIVVFLCKPRDLFEERFNVMKAEAESHIGKGYATKGVVGSALSNIFGLITWGWFRKKRNPMNSERNMFCSELCAESLRAGYPERPGSLIYHPTNIYPATLFNDTEIFVPWKETQARKRKAEGRSVIEVKPDFKV